MTEVIPIYPTSIKLEVKPKTHEIQEQWIEKSSHSAGGYFRHTRRKLHIPELSVIAQLTCEDNIFKVGGMYVDDNEKLWTAISTHALEYTPLTDSRHFKFPKQVILVNKPYAERG